MAASRAYRHQHLAAPPRGWRVRSKRAGDHVVRVAFPPGPRRRGSGRLLEILHPKKNPACENGECPIAQNPAEELLIFGNPSRRRNVGEYVKAMADQLEEDYRSKLRAGMGHEEAMTAAIAASIAGPAAIKEFKRRVGNPSRARNKLSKLYDIWEITPSDQTRRMYQRLARAEARKTLAELRKRTEGSGWRYIMKRPQENNPGWLDPKDKLWGHFAVVGGSADRTEFRSAREARAHARRLAKETGKSVHYRGPKNKPYVVRNPSAGGIGNHKPGCKCAFCKRIRARGSNPGAGESSQRRRRPGSSPRRRRNPSEVKQAVSLFQTFHGRDPKEIAEKQESAAMRLEYTALGDLSYLIVQPPSGRPVQINFEGDGVKLASAPNGRQLYAIGGNQNLSSLLDKFTDDPEKDFIDLGEGLEVQYEARKIHSNFAATDWYHKFGERNGALPRLMYDKLKKRIFFIGGEYFIDTTDAVSPGIEN